MRLNLEPDAGAWAVGVLQPVDADPGAGGSCHWYVNLPARSDSADFPIGRTRRLRLLFGPIS